jgi:Protein of unknown function, DUF481
MSLRYLQIAIIARFAAAAAAQTPPKPEPDTLLLNNGEKLIGHLVRASGGSVRFKSDGVGEVNVAWGKIKELHSAGQFAVIPKDVKLGRKPVTTGIPEGTVSEADQKIEVAGAAGEKTVPVANVDQVVDLASFNKETSGHEDFFRDWKGTATLGASFVEATQNSRTITDSVSLVRAIPDQDWLARRNRTSFDFSSSYGLVSQPNTPTVKTSIYHADAERDEYFSPAAFGFGQAQFDHNYSQGLDLQQTYVGGFGWSVFKNPNEGLDLKGGISFIRQQFSGSTTAKNLAASVFDEKYLRKFFHGTTFAQEFSVSPAWTQTRALSAFGSASLALPVYKHFSFTVGAIDNFLNDPPPGFKKNSVQFTTGITYVLP